MNVMRWLAGLLLALLLPGAALAQAADADAAALAALQRRLAPVTVLRGEFVQEKQLQGFAKPLRSEGRFVLASGRGVWWQTLRPVASELVLDKDGIRAEGKAGRAQPGMRAIGGLMFALMRGDLAALQQQFILHPTLLAGDDWALRLQPKGGAARALRELRLAGGRHLRQLEIEDRRGEIIRLSFSALSELPAQLSAEEARRFD